ncbi:S41 family peptidase [Thiomicrospira sp. WB1]|uniref:S41 family peptidase n=1 Tax=Thiomicrospira sp. WB1 TaxID=1685380 RepID=UPI000746DF11|nr:S41 family peptidase [Thiomicrospira sp. WB1]KUJ72186.1 peptidase S41 [Thiomicrospira sp. WB1]
MGLGALFGLVLAAGTTVIAKESNSEPQAETQTVTLPLEELRSFVEVFDRVSSAYVDPVENEKLLEGAIGGMLSNLDPHSSYLPAKEYKKMQEHTKGEFGGLGMEVGMEDGFVKVIAPIDDTPAKKAGVQAGDLIVKLDGEPVKGKTLSEAVKVMRGKPGTTITMSILRDGVDKPIELELTRAVIQVKSVKEKLLEDGMGYVRISQFQLRTGQDLGESIRTLEAANDGALNGLVLDLRNNPGGVLRAAVDVSDAFLTGGKRIVYTKGRVEDAQMSFDSANGDILKGKPIVVLINEGSASASEIVSGALQDHKRALIAGRGSFGKGSVQTLIPLNNGGAIKVTTARYYTPSGRSIQSEGIEPDIKIDQVKVEKLKDTGFGRIKEKDLSGHLMGENESNGSQSDEKASETEDESDFISTDYELYEALNLLKGMALARQMQAE